MRKITADTDMYAIADVILKYLVGEYVEMFDDFKSNLLNKDELNVLTKVDNLYDKMESLLIDKMLELAQLQFEYIQQDDYDYELINTAWLWELLGSFNETTKYVYKNEIERKRAYLFEALMSSGTPMKEADKALRLWCLMIGQMAIDVTDKATFTAYEANGVTEVEWVTEKDGKQCDECDSLDGKVFPINKVPNKPHIRCRCFCIPR